MDEHGLDKLQGLGLNRDANATEENVILYSATSVHPAVAEADVLRLVVEGNTQASAQLTVFVEYALGY